MKRICVIVFLLISTAAFSAAQQLDTLGLIDPYPATGISALWGYTAPDGREYALLGITGSTANPGGTTIIDITVDHAPRKVAHIVGPNSTWREMKTYRQYAYIVVDQMPSATGVQIIDLSQLPDTARLVQTFNYTSGAKKTSESHTITITDGFMYLNGCRNWSPGGILIFDLRNDPLNPQFASEYQPQYIHDSYVLRDTIYASAINTGGGLIIANAKNKASVQTIGRIAYTGSGTHNAWVTKDRRYVLTADETSPIRNDVKVWDISNLPTIPTATSATFTVNPTSSVHNVHIRGDYAYCSWYQGYGLQIANISNPTSPVLAAGYRTATGNTLAWETYPYFPSGKIIIGDPSTGLWIFRFSELAARRPVGLLAPANSDTVRSRDSIRFRWTKATDLNKDPHWYEVRLRGTGVDTIWRANDSLSLFTNLIALQNDQSYTWRVTVRDEWNTTASVDSFRFIYKTGPNSVETGRETPVSFGLEQNYPNPFNPSTRIEFRLAASGFTVLTVYDLLGREVSRLVNDVLPAGHHFRNFDAGNLASGIYIYRLQSGSSVEIKRMLLLR